jgi:hypothetical protein
VQTLLLAQLIRAVVVEELLALLVLEVLVLVEKE